MEAHLIVIQACLLAFLGLWFSARFLTNLFEGFRLMEIFPITMEVCISAFQPVARAIAGYLTCTWLPALGFLGDMVWQFLAATLFEWARMPVSQRLKGIECPE